MGLFGKGTQEKTLTQEVTEASQRLGLKLKRISPTSAVFEEGGGESTVQFDSLERVWRSAKPDQKAPVVEAFLRALNSRDTAATAAPLEQLKSRIIVRVAQSNYANIPGMPPEAIPPKWDIVPEHLSVFIAVDEENTVWTAGNDKLQEWGISFEQAYDIGLENLRRRTDFRQQAKFPPVPEISYYNAGDAYDASRALLLGDFVQPFPSGGVVFGVPTRDHFFWSPVRGRQTLQVIPAMLQLNAKFLEEGAKPITNQLFWFSGSTFELIPIEWTQQGPKVGAPPPGLRAAINANP